MTTMQRREARELLEQESKRRKLKRFLLLSFLIFLVLAAVVGI